MMDAGVWKSQPSIHAAVHRPLGSVPVQRSAGKKVNSVVSNLPARFFILLRGKKKPKKPEYFSKSPTLFSYQVVLYLRAAGFESIGSNRWRDT